VAPVNHWRPSTVIAAGITVAGRTVSESLIDFDQLEAEIIEWVDT
jgi:hypothetical protein